MKTLNLLAGSTALAALMALPVAALTVSVDTDLSVAAEAEAGSADVAGSADAGASVEAGTEAATTADAGVTAETDAALEAFVGDVVLTSDGETVGTVQTAAAEADAKTRLVIALDSSVSSKVSTFSVTVDATAQSDGEIALGWTKAELVSALDSKTMAMPDNG